MLSKVEAHDIGLVALTVERALVLCQLAHVLVLLRDLVELPDAILLVKSVTLVVCALKVLAKKQLLNNLWRLVFVFEHFGATAIVMLALTAKDLLAVRALNWMPDDFTTTWASHELVHREVHVDQVKNVALNELFFCAALL